MTRPSPRERCIAVAMELFHQKGFHGTALDEVIHQAEISKGTFYNHFRDKDDLIKQVLEENMANWQESLGQKTSEIGDENPVDQLLSCFDVLHENFKLPDYRGCYCVMAAMEFSLPTDPIHQLATSNIEGLKKFWADILRRAGGTEPERFADEFYLVFSGSISAEVMDRTKAYPTLARELGRSLIMQYLPGVQNSDQSIPVPADS